MLNVFLLKGNSEYVLILICLTYGLIDFATLIKPCEISAFITQASGLTFKI